MDYKGTGVEEFIGQLGSQWNRLGNMIIPCIILRWQRWIWGYLCIHDLFLRWRQGNLTDKVMWEPSGRNQECFRDFLATREMVDSFWDGKHYWIKRFWWKHKSFVLYILRCLLNMQIEIPSRQCLYWSGDQWSSKENWMT